MDEKELKKSVRKQLTEHYPSAQNIDLTVNDNEMTAHAILYFAQKRKHDIKIFIEDDGRINFDNIHNDNIFFH
jgi:hypothetical protein